MATFKATLNNYTPMGSGRGAHPDSRMKLLFAASIFSSYSLLSQGQSETLTITVEPPSPPVGQNVSFKLGTLPENSVICLWYRGEAAEINLIFSYFLGLSEGRKGPAHTGRETLGSDCSLHITNLSSSDSGNYTVTVDQPTTVENGRVDLKVAASIFSSYSLLNQGQTLTITVEPPIPPVGQNVSFKLGTLPENSVACRWYRGEAASKNLIFNYFLGLSDGREGPAHTGRETVGSDCSLHITNLSSSDSGNYTVTVEQPTTSEHGRVDLKVAEPSLSSPDHLGCGVITLIVLGSVAVTLALMGLLFYSCCPSVLCLGCLSSHAFTVKPAELKGGQNVTLTPEVDQSSSEVGNTYQTLQFQHQDEYEQLQHYEKKPNS